MDVDCTTKIQILKQITTIRFYNYHGTGCRLHHKDTNFKANHNNDSFHRIAFGDVDCTTKIQILKQITTQVAILRCLLQMSSTTKIRILKQITTVGGT